MSLYESRKPKKKYKRNKLAKDVLYYIAAGAVIYVICSSPTGARRFLKGVKKEWRRRSAQRALDRLQKENYISYKEQKDGSLVVTITKEGKRKVQEWDLDNLRIEKPNKWDTRWRIVAFDIAEERKKGRDELRYLLHRLGFYQLQKSILVYPYSCQSEIELIKDIFSIPRKEVLYFSVDTIPEEGKLRKHFNLSSKK